MEWIRGGPTSLNAQNIKEALDSSLMRLQTDYIDIFQLHWPDRCAIALCSSSLLSAQDNEMQACVYTVCPQLLTFICV